MAELETKIVRVRAILEQHGLGAVRLRGIEGSRGRRAAGPAVLLAAEVGVAEVLVTRSGAWVLTDAIEADRLKEEEVPRGLEVWSGPWAEPRQREAFVRAQRGAVRATPRRGPPGPAGRSAPAPGRGRGSAARRCRART